MQPFPTAFWKKTAEPVIEEVSCFTPVNSEDINGDGVYILQDSPLKPDNTQNAIALGDLAVGLHKDFKESELPTSDGFPMAHANRDGGFKTTNVNHRGNFSNDIGNFIGWNDLVEEAGLGLGSGSEKELVNFVLRNYLNIWRSNSAHKTNPITTTISESVSYTHLTLPTNREV